MRFATYYWKPELVAKILHMYSEGMPISEIQYFFKVDVEEILDTILPYV